VGGAIEQALSLSPAQRAARAAPDLAFVRRNTASVWAGRILRDVRLASRADDAVRAAGGGLGLGLSWRVGPELGLHGQGGAMGGSCFRPLHAGALLEA